MTGIPWACAFWATATPAPLRSTRSMTEQPLVSCCWASVAYLPVSFSAFWMSVVNPIFLKELSRAGRSPFSQRLDESASGSITQAFLVPPLEPPLLEALLFELLSLPQAARATSPTAARAVAPVILDLIML